MHICFGTDKHPIYMSATRDYTLFEMMEKCRLFHRNGTLLHLEYHPSLYMNIPNEMLLEFACQMTVEYHNHLLHMMHPDVWQPMLPACKQSHIQHYASDEDEQDEFAYDTEDDEAESIEVKSRPIDPRPFNCRRKWEKKDINANKDC